VITWEALETGQTRVDRQGTFGRRSRRGARTGSAICAGIGAWVRICLGVGAILNVVGQFDVGATLVVALGRYKACPCRDIKGEALGRWNETIVNDRVLHDTRGWRLKGSDE
jgi:hypothetical protein